MGRAAGSTKEARGDAAGPAHPEKKGDPKVPLSTAGKKTAKRAYLACTLSMP